MDRLKACRQFGLLLVFLAGVSSHAASAFADVSWLDQVKDCRSFSDKLAEYQKGITDPNNPTPTQTVELREIRKVACHGRFRVCAFEICAGEKEEPAPADATTTEGTKKPGFGFDEKVEDSVDLSWMKSDMSCEALKEQVLARYLPLGSPEQLNEEKKRELAAVKAEMCSERFARCKYKQCIAKEPSEEEEVAVQQVMVRDRIEAEAKLAQELATFQKEREAMIAVQLAKEKREGLTWQRFAVPAELQQQERAATPDPKKQQQTKRPLRPMSR